MFQGIKIRNKKFTFAQKNFIKLSYDGLVCFFFKNKPNY